MPSEDGGVKQDTNLGEIESKIESLWLRKDHGCVITDACI